MMTAWGCGVQWECGPCTVVVGARFCPGGRLTTDGMPQSAVCAVQVQKGLIDCENLFDLLRTEPAVKEKPHAKPLVVRWAPRLVDKPRQVLCLL